MPRKKKEDIDKLKNDISSLEGEMRGLNNDLNLNPEELFPDSDHLPLNQMEIYDYEQEIKDIKKDCDETLGCLSSLYLNAGDIEKRNISNIIKNDAIALSDLKFSIFCSKRGLINLMKQLDSGINDPDMYSAVGTFQKEIRDSVKMLYDIQKKMKDFYKDIKEEISNINAGEDSPEEDIKEIEENEDVLHLPDFKKLNEEIDKYKSEKDKDR